MGIAAATPTWVTRCIARATVSSSSPGNMHMGWGNVVMVRHSYREPAEGNAIKTIDSLYGHLDTMLVREGQEVARGQQIATIGTAFGLYEAHLHFEIRRNIHIGMYRSLYARDFSNYFDPTGSSTRTASSTGAVKR